MEYVIIIVIAILVVLILYGVITYNSLVSLRNRVRDQWAQIDVQLKRRFDLVPNLVDTVKGYAKHEKQTLESIVETRNKFLSATTHEESLRASDELSNVVSRLFALSESYPDLKANVNFVELQTALKETEDKVAYSRQFYNDSIYTYNNKIEMFPSNIIAKLFGFKKQAFMEIPEEQKENPKVNF